MEGHNWEAAGSDKRSLNQPKRKSFKCFRVDDEGPIGITVASFNRGVTVIAQHVAVGENALGLDAIAVSASAWHSNRK